MSNSYVLLEKIVVPAAGASSVTFANIPQTGYTDLVVKATSRSDYAATSILGAVRFSGSSASIYSDRTVYGNGTTALSGANSANNFAYAIESTGSTATANTFGNSEIYIPNYTSANYKSFSHDGVAETNATAVNLDLLAGLWASTSAITSIQIFPGGGSLFTQYSTFYLYGVAALGTTPTIAPKATGGDVIMTDGTYWYHAFTSSGTFTPAVALSCDVLQVAGGGSGGNTNGGGGGAGGVYYSTGNSIGTAQTVTIGAGGAQVTTNAHGNNGSNSTFGSLTAAVGGGGGGHQLTQAGNTGGSGGGSSYTASTGASGTSGQGNTGGGGNSVISYAGGGGGGAGGAGGNGTSSTGGVGGTSISTYSSWATATGTGVSGNYAGGGGGGQAINSNKAAGGGGGAGYGGDGTSGSATNGLPADANTGSGGGGGGSNGTNYGGAGGSGIIIVRYAV